MKISEMTMRGPDLSKQAELFANKNKETWYKNGKHVADIEDYKVIQLGNYYSLWDDAAFVACCSLTDDNIVDNVYVSPDYRGKQILLMLLWFFKTRLNRSPLVLGKVHSKDMQEVVKGLSRFNKHWYNVNTGEKEPFALDTLDNYYSHIEVTPWRLVLENAGNFSEWPMYNGGGFVMEAYEPYLD